MIRAALLAIALAVTLLIPSAALADTPLTAARLHLAYAELPQVAAAAESQLLTPELLAFLAGDAPTDQKAALVSALGWRAPGQTRGRRFLEQLATSQGLTVGQLTIERLRGVDLFVLGYLMAMDDPHEMRPLDPAADGLLAAPPWEILAVAAAALPGDFTVQLVRALVEGQRDFSSAWCEVYLETALVLQRFPAGQRNLRNAAVAQAQAAVSPYRGSCGTPVVEARALATAPAPAPAAAAPQRPAIPVKPELNQVYAVTAYRQWMVTATQGGVVVWDRRTGQAVEAHLEPICLSLMVFQDALWVGCEHRVLRWDGGSWRAYLHDAASTEAFKLRLGPGGELVVAHGGKLLTFFPEYDLFRAASSTLGTGEGYDLMWDAEGTLWRVRLMEAVERGSQRFQVGSAAYPGPDPRALYQDPGGGMWVVDFAHGFYRFDEAEGRFHRVPGVAGRGSDVEVDAERRRVWLLHYTDGVYLRDGDGPARFFDLRSLLYLRDLYVDADGDVWIAGWTHLARLRGQAGDWSVEAWKIQ